MGHEKLHLHVGCAEAFCCALSSGALQHACVKVMRKVVRAQVRTCPDCGKGAQGRPCCARRGMKPYRSGGKERSTRSRALGKELLISFVVFLNNIIFAIVSRLKNGN